MLAEERFALILNLLAEKRTATVQELCEALNASESTIRRDLTELDRQGRLNKVHGGATLPDGQFLADEPTMAAKETLAVGQKRSIAQAAADLVRAGDFVYIDAGSTTLAMVRALSGPALDAHYVTNGIAHARLLAQKSCNVCVPGGLLRPKTEAIIGAAALTSLQQPMKERRRGREPLGQGAAHQEIPRIGNEGDDGDLPVGGPGRDQRKGCVLPRRSVIEDAG